MKFDEIYIGQKVTPFQKTEISKMSIKDYYERRRNGKFLKENGFLYITRIEKPDIIWLSNIEEGKYILECKFNIRDLNPFIEKSLKDLLLED